MGSYSCEDFLLPFLEGDHVRQARQINEAVAHALKEEFGKPYKGVLYGGFMVTADGLRVLEYNARFGDPEALNVLSLLRGNFLELCVAVAEGGLRANMVEFEKKATVCKYVVPTGYPDQPVRGEKIDVSSVPQPSNQLRIYYAAVTESPDHDGLLLTGSRTVAFVGIADSVSQAETIAEDAAVRVRGPVEHRRDIGTRELIQKRIEHLSSLRARKREQFSGTRTPTDLRDVQQQR
jgi:phosphoribosylamine--glycine ligase